MAPASSFGASVDHFHVPQATFAASRRISSRPRGPPAADPHRRPRRICRRAARRSPEPRSARVPKDAMACKFETATTLRPVASARPFAAVRPTRTPVNDPGPAAAAKPSMSVILRLCRASSASISGNMTCAKPSGECSATSSSTRPRLRRRRIDAEAHSLQLTLNLARWYRSPSNSSSRSRSQPIHFIDRVRLAIRVQDRHPQAQRAGQFVHNRRSGYASSLCCRFPPRENLRHPAPPQPSIRPEVPA